VIKALLQVLTLFLARVRGNGCFAASIWADGAGFLGELYQTYGYFQVKYVAARTSLNPEYLPDE
jgi:hypothetical protein